MLRFLLVQCILLLHVSLNASTILVKNIDELNAANKKAQPGDVIILQNGEWKNVIIKLDCNGTADKPIRLKAQTAGKVVITGESSLKIGGNFIIVDGLYFTRGYAGDDAVISFRSSKEKLANNCQVTNTVVDDFNNPKRMDENNWVLFYGKNNRLDHCSFRDKKNMGVLLAVILDDDRSRENRHSIDHNYFGRRPVLGSNGGEMIRVGVSQHCQFNSNTEITNNFFEHCDGETEIISIKSGSNLVAQNVFKESQGSVVLRHGDNNIVRNNLFLGNDKVATGGVRVINKGQTVTNNFFYRCRGTDFRSPLAIMNGIPNSPAHRYVQVVNANISGNTFYECSPISFGEGSDAERTLAPDSVQFFHNTFYNTRDSIIYKVFDKMNGISFSNNKVSRAVKQNLFPGFEKNSLTITPAVVTIPGTGTKVTEKNILQLAGTAWWKTTSNIAKKQTRIIANCANATELYAQLEKPGAKEITLTGRDYIFHRPLNIAGNVVFKTSLKEYIDFHTVPGMLTLFELMGNSSLTLHNLKLDGSDVKATHFIANDSSGPSAHFNITMAACSLRYFNRNYGCENFIYLYKSSIADSIVIAKSYFENNATHVLMMNNETDDKGYYNAEKIRFDKNTFVNQKGMIMDIYRGGNDESTLGPDLLVIDNSFDNCNTEDDAPLVKLTGVQKTNFSFNAFMECNPQKSLIVYKDTVRARHIEIRNLFTKSGNIERNNFVTEEKNNIQ